MMNLDLFPTPAAIALPDAPVIVCYGAGVDSTAMLIALRDAGIRPDAITFADTGGEKPETYDMIPIMNDWLRRQGFPLIQVCKYETSRAPYSDLEGNNLANETLPSLAFGMKSCSIKWKQQPQDYVIMGCKGGPNKCDPHPVWIEAQARGVKPVKLIGYDAGPADLRRAGRLKDQDKHFQYRYPLQQLGWTREDCLDAIAQEGLPIPIKSACWFCPASQKWELYWLAGKHPELFERALEIEHRAMTGKHSRWPFQDCDYGPAWEDLISQPASQWPQVDITVGLGRSFAWNHWARVNNIVDQDGKVTADPAWLLAKADQLKAKGGNAADTRTC
jgi:hypothetical protein